MTPTTLRTGWWRWLAPANFLTALLVFCLPWVEVRCDKSAVQPPLQVPGAQRESIRPSQSPLWETVLTQSGLQAVYGGFSIPAAASRETASQRREALEIPVAPWLGVYAGLLMLAAAAGLLLRSFRQRRIAGLALGGAAFLILLVQGLIGFPIRDVFLKENQSAPAGRPFVEVRHTPWYYLSYALLCGGMASALLDRPRWQRPRGGYERI